MKMTGAKMVVESLHQEGVEVVFGYPGGAIMNAVKKFLMPASTDTNLLAGC